MKTTVENKSAGPAQPVSCQHKTDKDQAAPDLLQQSEIGFNFSALSINNSGFGSLYIQPKLTVNEPGDKYEQEADAMADKVMRMEKLDKTMSPLPLSAIQRKCTHCEEEEKKLQRKESGTQTPAVTRSLDNYVSGLNNGGQLLPASLRDFYEPRLGYDFSKVKIHNDARAAQSAQSIHALAYTHGNNIVFNSGQYSPQTKQGKRLLGHELAHIIQQKSNHQLLRKEEGTAKIEENIHDISQDAGTNVWKGLADRQEYIPAKGKTARKDLTLLNNIRIEFDPETCTVNLPTRVKFTHPKGDNWPFCSADNGSEVPKPVKDAAFNSIKSNFLSLANTWLNNWFSVRLTNCENDCADKRINIKATITEDNSNPTTTVIIANKKGRSCANASTIVIHALGLRGGGVEDSRLVHEVGHTVLGFPDEYPVEHGNKQTESVHRDDYSMAGDSTDFGDWMLLHERHFAFVPAFLEQIFPGCDAELTRNNRSDITFLLPFEIGGTSYEGGGVYGSTGFDMGLPLDVNRHLQLTLGARFHGIQSLDEPKANALLGGIRAGLSYGVDPSDGGIKIGGFGEIGGGSFSAADKSTENTYDYDRFNAPYYQFGGSIGYEFGPGSGPGSSAISIGLNLSYGSTFALSDDDMTRFGTKDWYFVGLGLGWQWHK